MEGQHIGTEHNPYNEADIRGDNAEQWENTAGEDTQSEWDDLKNVDAPAIHKEPAIGPKDPDVKFESTIKEATETNTESSETSVKAIKIDYPSDKEFLDNVEKLRFDGQAIFSDIDGTITNNTGEINPRAIEIINTFIDRGGIFIPVTGRARFESVKDIMAKLNCPYIVMNNGAEIYNRNGDRIDGSELSKEQLDVVFDAVKETGAVFMQNKVDPETGEEWLYTNGTAETDAAMVEAGVEDNVANEEGRIGLKSKYDPEFSVKQIEGQNYKIQIMSPDPDVIMKIKARFDAAHIPYILNMNSKIDGKPRWIEAIVGTKIGGIQKLIDSYFDTDVVAAEVVGDGGNDLTMYEKLHNRAGEPIPNTFTAVQNACQNLRDKAEVVLDSRWNEHYIHGKDGEVEDSILGGGAAITEMILKHTRLAYLNRFRLQLKDRAKMYQERQDLKDHRPFRDAVEAWYKKKKLQPSKINGARASFEDDQAYRDRQSESKSA